MRVEPFGTSMDNYLTARICQTLVMISTGKPQNIEDFLVRFELPEAKPQRQPWQQKLAFAKMIALAYNAKGVNT